MKQDYQARIYETYVSHFQRSELIFDLEKSTLWSKPYNYYFRNWLPENKNSSVADIACGQGKLLQFFIDKGYVNVFGVDVSEQQVMLAKQVIENVDQGDALKWLLSRPINFDLITGIDIIEHFGKADVINFLEACYGALKPGGRIVVQTPNAASIFSSTVRYGDFTHEVCFTPNLLKRLLELCGFQNCEVREVGPVIRRKSFFSLVRAVLWRFLRLGIIGWNLVETGSRGESVLTRVFLISAIRPGEKA